MEAANQKLVVYNPFAFEKGRFVKLEDAERGGVHVCMEGQYAFSEDEVTDAMNKALVLSKAQEEFRLGTHFPIVDSCNSLSANNWNSVSRKSDTGKCCVVYFWVGRAASKVSEKTFRFHARVQIVHVTQEREPVELLAHWGNRSVIHRGNRKDLLTLLRQLDVDSDEGLKSVLYHVRTDWKYKTTRAIQVPFEVDPDVGFLWVGKNSTKEDARKAHAVADRISNLFVFGTALEVTKRNAATSDSFSLNKLNEASDDADDSVKELSVKSKQTFLLTKRFRIVAEGLEPRAFFSLFPNGKQPHCSGPMPPLLVSASSLKPSVSVIPTNLPRLLICSCIKGYFSVEELPHYDQMNLDTSCCAILDPGPHSPVYLWHGSSASDVVVKLSRKAVEVWLETLEDGRRNWEGELATGESVVDGVVAVREGAEEKHEEVLNSDGKKPLKMEEAVHVEVADDISPELEALLHTVPLEGLTDAQVAEQTKTNPLLKFLSYFLGPISYLLEIACILSGIFEDWIDFGILLGVLIINACIGFFEEARAESALDALKNTLALKTRVWRNSKLVEIDSNTLVPGDIIALRLGDIIPADCRLLGVGVQGEESEGTLQIDQAALTGESLPVNKGKGATAYSSAIVKQGQMLAVVTKTGIHTYIGRAANLIAITTEEGHFQKIITSIGNFLVIITCVMAFALFFIRTWAVPENKFDDLGTRVKAALLEVLVLTIAAIPVGLPTIMSVTMAVGASQLAKKEVIVKRLTAIEELASVSILCSDKTGTLTMNKLSFDVPYLSNKGNTTDDFEGTGVKYTEQDLLLHSFFASEPGAQDAIESAIRKAAQERVTVLKERENQDHHIPGYK
ncbi:UNVERIFIED_CONTAM: hypothetical protein HDU68_003249, partial [Siphonaria sp. JEL0065]